MPPLSAFAHSLWPSGLQVVTVTLPLPPGAEGLVGTRLGFAADLHAGSMTPDAWIEEAAQALSRQRLDVLLLGGDLVDRTPGSGPRLASLLARWAHIPAPLGHFMVPGNHEYDALSLHELRSALGPSWRLLENERVQLPGWSLVGLDDPDGGPWAVPEGSGAGPTVLLTHRPDAVVDVRGAWGQSDPWLALAGHLHGGQVRLPGLRPSISKTAYPDRFDRGLTHEGETAVFVTQGVGLSRLPLRINAPPEVVVVVAGPHGSAPSQQVERIPLP
jgi:predicted MPP superfamily phosphohydrolase